MGHTASPSSHHFSRSIMLPGTSFHHHLRYSGTLINISYHFMLGSSFHAFIATNNHQPGLPSYCCRSIPIPSPTPDAKFPVATVSSSRRRQSSPSSSSLTGTSLPGAWLPGYHRLSIFTSHEYYHTSQRVTMVECIDACIVSYRRHIITTVEYQQWVVSISARRLVSSYRFILPPVSSRHRSIRCIVNGHAAGQS